MKTKLKQRVDAVGKMRIDVEMIEAMKDFLGHVNCANMDQIQLYKGNKPIKMRNIEEWRLTGLSNVDYIRDRYYDSKRRGF